MMVLGVEEPLQGNKQLNALDEAAGEVKLCRYHDGGLNRYSFVWVGDHERREERFRTLLVALGGLLSAAPHWYLVWEDSNRGEPDPRAVAKRQRRAEEGWAVHVGPTLGVAHRPCLAETVDRLRPAGHAFLPGDGDPFLIWGGPPDPIEFIHPPLRASLEVLVARRELSPSPACLSWVRERGLALGYPLRDMQSHLGLVLVTARTLDRGALRQQDFIHTEHSGDEASLAWRYMEQP